MDRLTAMRVFVEIVERGSVSAAAESLDMSRAMASRYLEGLESWLGARLLHRTTRKLTLSEAGEQALKSCREMVELADDVVGQTSQRGEVQGRLRITSSASFAQTQLTAAIVEFQRRYPKVHVDLFVVDRTVNLVEERIDLAIRISNQIDGGLVARQLAVCRSILCASPAYLAAAGVPKHPQDLTAHRCIINTSGFAPTYKLRRGDEVVSVKVNAAFTSNETSAVRAAALAGAGIAMLPTYYVRNDIESGSLRVVLPAFTLDPMKVQAVFLSRRHQPRPLRLLIEFLAERFGGDVAPWDKGLGPARSASKRTSR